MSDDVIAKHEPVCFVIMGYGEKINYKADPIRTLNLDKTYDIIKAAVEACGVKCIRSDEEVMAGVIDKPMYQYLYSADIVIADLSTSNENAIYELGVRHALKPSTTIVIAEEDFHLPFDLKSVTIRKYKHLGEDLGFTEANRLKDELENVNNHLLKSPAVVDSPVYTFLNEMVPPNLTKAAASNTTTDAIEVAKEPSASFRALFEEFKKARAKNDFSSAKALLKILHETNPSDSYLIQQLVLATYKSKQPDELSALEEALELMQSKLSPETTGDPETLGLMGAINKRLWESKGDKKYLDASISAYEKGFYIKRDYYNGINYAFVLNRRALIQEDRNEAIADVIIAKRVRIEVEPIAEKAKLNLAQDEEGKAKDPDAEYWIAATHLEAAMGAGKDISALKAAVLDFAPAKWMKDSTQTQMDELGDLINKGNSQLL